MPRMYMYIVCYNMLDDLYTTGAQWLAIHQTFV